MYSSQCSLHTPTQMSIYRNFFLLLCLCGRLAATNYYVSLSGNDSYDGKKPTPDANNAGPWKTLKYAASTNANLQPGDTVFVQAGDYGNENVVFTKSGTAGKPIVFIGYKTKPLDTPPVLVTNATANTTFDASDMPTYSGTNRASGTGFDCSKQHHLVFKNFQIRNYAYGFMGGGPSQDAGHLLLENINIMSIGDTNASYSGQAFLFGSMSTKFSNNNTLNSCLVINAAAEGIGMNGNNNLLNDCNIFCNENNGSAPTDYYIIICGSYNTLNRCYIERKAGLKHNGHGIGAKTNAEQVVDKGLPYTPIPAQYNTFNYCVAKNLGESFYVRHRTAQYNLFYHCKAIGTHTGVKNSSGGEGNAITVRDGASDNTFDGCHAENCHAGIIFEDTVEDGDTGSNPPGHPGNNNQFLNCIFNNCYIGAYYSELTIPSDAGNNLIAQCTFYKTRYIHYAQRHCAQMKYIGNIYVGCLPLASGGNFKDGTYAADIIANGNDTYFKQNNFINIQGGMPSGFIGVNDNIGVDPSFVDAANNDFHLATGSPCIDKVDAIPLATNPRDYDSLARYNQQKSDMGAFEFYPSVPTLQTLVEDHLPVLHLYPNPSCGIVHLTPIHKRNYSIQVLNSLGQEVYQAPYSEVISLIHLPPGVYILNILNGKNMRVQQGKLCLQ